ncbi:MAG: NADH-quinone oxidoreductase subunit J [Gemmataceae bacterium]|nr:NADH-quinone oxidoreductase subunit J [Gemmataceae bacterium]
MFASLFLQTDEPRRVALNVFLRENWKILIPALLAFVGVYFILPRARRNTGAIGGGILGLALILAGIWWVRLEGVSAENILFGIFASLSVLGAVLMLAQTNPVRAALSFALVVLSSCGLFLLLQAPFLTAATIIIYAGAIVVTFLFVLMLAQQSGMSNADHRSREAFLATLAGVILLGALAISIDRAFDNPGEQEARRLATAQTTADVNAVLGDPATEKQSHTANLEKLFKSDATEFDGPWRKGDVEGVNKVADRLLRDRRSMSSTLTPNEGTQQTAAGIRPLPPDNVAGLGRVLFMDYLVPVELAAVLLLVATIGAIAILGRGQEGLR